SRLRSTGESTIIMPAMTEAEIMAAEAAARKAGPSRPKTSDPVPRKTEQPERLDRLQASDPLAARLSRLPVDADPESTLNVPPPAGLSTDSRAPRSKRRGHGLVYAITALAVLAAVELMGCHLLLATRIQ